MAANVCGNRVANSYIPRVRLHPVASSGNLLVGSVSFRCYAIITANDFLLDAGAIPRKDNIECAIVV